MSLPVSVSVEEWVTTRGGPLKGHTGGEIGADTEAVVGEMEKRRGTSPQQLLEGLHKFSARLKLIQEKGRKTGIPGVMGVDELGMEEPVGPDSLYSTVAVVYNDVVYGGTMTASGDPSSTVWLKFAEDSTEEEWDARCVRKAKRPRLLNSELMELQADFLGFKYASDEEACAHHMLKVGEGATVLWLEGEDSDRIPASLDELGGWYPRRGTVVAKSVLHNGVFATCLDTFNMVFVPIEIVLAFEREEVSAFDFMSVLKHKSGRIRKKPGQYQAGEEGSRGGSVKKGRPAMPQRTPSRESVSRESFDSPRTRRSRTSTPKSSPMRLPPGNAKNSPEKPEAQGSRADKMIAAFGTNNKEQNVGVEEYRQLRSMVQDVGMGVADLRAVVNGNNDMLRKKSEPNDGKSFEKVEKAVEKSVEKAVGAAAKAASAKMANELAMVATKIRRDFAREMEGTTKAIVAEFGREIAITVQGNIGGQALVMSVDGGPHIPVAQVKPLEDDYTVPIQTSQPPRTSTPAPPSPRPIFVQPASPAPRSNGAPKAKKAKRDSRAAQGLLKEYYQEPEYGVHEKLMNIPKADLPHWLINYHYNGMQQKPIANYASPISRDAGTFKALAPALLLYARSKDPDDLEMELNRLKANAQVIWMAFRSALRVPNKGTTNWDSTISLHNWFLSAAKHLCLLGVYSVGEIESVWPATWRTTPEEDKGTIKELLAPLSPEFHGTGVEDWFAAFKTLFFYHAELKPEHMGVAEVKRAMASARSSFVRARKGRASGGRAGPGLDDSTSSQASNGDGDQDEVVEEDKTTV